MIYQNNVRITFTLFIKAKDISGIKHGDYLANSCRDNCEIIFDGGIDFRQAFTIENYSNKKKEQLQKQGKGLIDHNGSCYQYVLRSK